MNEINKNLIRITAKEFFILFRHSLTEEEDTKSLMAIIYNENFQDIQKNVNNLNEKPFSLFLSTFACGTEQTEYSIAGNGIFTVNTFYGMYIYNNNYYSNTDEYHTDVIDLCDGLKLIRADSTPSSDYFLTCKNLVLNLYNVAANKFMINDIRGSYFNNAFMNFTDNEKERILADIKPKLVLHALNT